MEEQREAPGTPDEWAAFLRTQDPSAHVMDLLPVLDAEKLSAAGRIDALAVLERCASWVAACQVPLLAGIEAQTSAELPVGADFETTLLHDWDYAAEQVACALKLSGAGAGDRLEVARALMDRLPQTLELLAQGEISWRQAKTVVDACAVLDDEMTAKVEDAVVAKLPTQAAHETRRMLNRTIARLDPEGAAARHEQRRLERTTVNYPQPDGMAMFGAIVPAEQAALMEQAVDAHAATFADDGRTLSQKRADALFDLITGTTNTQSVGGRSAAVVQITVPLDVLIGASEEPAELKGYGPITAGQARDVAFAEGTVWRRLITHPTTGMVVKTDPTTYKPTAETTRHVEARDRHCAFPTCRMPAHRADLDHVVEFDHHNPQAGGQSVPENLIPLCRRHHGLKHRGGWKVVRDDTSGQTHWTAPTGHTYTNTPDRWTD
ncbi:HNH endonuclease signature motif containing protein [Streptomyces sp. NBC_01465]|uniref:HNH endonuclease signature motif containing protein n=1 Tax=Streptomyces sp. NBC_01465 TaxID=2903878 RepID=UPI002E379E4D|nr:DUF222 domain-containing protein [Streptomyces sp. NBC_01465]